MLFCENGQEVVDSLIMAYKIAEDRRVLLPVMVNMDGFSLSHVIEPIDFPSQEEVDKFLPQYNPLFTLHPDKPVTMGAYGMPEIYTEAKYAQETALINSKEVVEEVFEDFAKMFGRQYKLVETYNTEGADFVFIALGAIGENIKTAIEELKKEGKRAGLVQLRLYRPFPWRELLDALRDKKRIAVTERVMPGGAQGGPLFHEIATLLYNNGISIKMENYVLGLGGRDVMPETFMDIYNGVAKEISSLPTKEKNFMVIGVRG